MKVMTYDVGTTGMKGCLFDISKDMEIKYIAGALYEYPLKVIPGGGVEQAPEDWWKAMCGTTGQILLETGIQKEDIKGISFCSQVQTLVMIDEEGNALYPAFSCMDTRARDQFSKYMETGFKVEGLNAVKVLKFMKATGGVSASVKDPMWKYHWIKENEPEVFKRAYKWVDAKEYLIGRATGKILASRDVAGITFLYDVKKGRWSESLCRTFDIDMDKLPDLCESTDTVGELLPERAKELGLSPGIPVVSGGSDISLCQVGAGSLKVGDVNVYSGTSGWVCTTVPKLHLDLKNIIGSIVGADPKTYNYIAESETSGKCLEWVKERLNNTPIDTYEEMIELAQKSPPGSNGVMFAPWMHGNRCPFEDSYARGMLFNIDVDTRGRDIMNSVIEGICLHKRWMLEASETSFETNPVVRFTGGTSQSPYIAQVLANILGREVETIENPRQVGAMGAAALMAVNFGMIKDVKDIKDFIKVSARYSPEPESHAVYNSVYPEFKELHSRNKSGYKALNS